MTARTVSWELNSHSNPSSTGESSIVKKSILKQMPPRWCQAEPIKSSCAFFENISWHRWPKLTPKNSTDRRFIVASKGQEHKSVKSESQPFRINQKFWTHVLETGFTFLPLSYTLSNFYLCSLGPSGTVQSTTNPCPGFYIFLGGKFVIAV